MDGHRLGSGLGFTSTSSVVLGHSKIKDGGRRRALRAVFLGAPKIKASRQLSTL